MKKKITITLEFQQTKKYEMNIGGEGIESEVNDNFLQSRLSGS